MNKGRIVKRRINLAGCCHGGGHLPSYWTLSGSLFFRSGHNSENLVCWINTEFYITFNWVDACMKPLVFCVFCSISPLMDDTAVYVQQDWFVFESRSCPMLKSPILKDFLRCTGVHVRERETDSIFLPFLVS